MAVSGDTMIDTVFDGRYRIMRKLGAGGMANVYLAEDQELGRRVAIKILNDRHAGDDQFIERFRREAKNAAGLSHPNIVSIYDRGEAEGTYYIAMEYLDGRTLKELIVSRGPAPIKTTIEYARQILAAIGHAHRNGIVHRDIKPHNVVVDPDGRLKVTDFGIARSGASQMTEAGSIIGTAQYLSPEQAKGAPVDQRSDLYAVGVVLYEMLTGKVPFSGDTPLEIAMKHLSKVPEPPSKLRPEISEDLDMIVLRALAKDPDERYQSAEEMAADLSRVARGLGVSDETADAATAVLGGSGATAETMIAPRRTAVAPPPPTRTPPAAYYGYEGPPRRRRPLWPWLLALLLLVGAGLAAYFAYDRIQDELNASKGVRVPYVVGIREANAVNQIRNKDLTPRVQRKFDQNVQAGFVASQKPEEGTKVDKNDPVTIIVSKGKPRSAVPDVVGKTESEAVKALSARHLDAKPVAVFSETAEEDTVTAQDPKAGTSLVWGSTVRINVSRGPEPVSVPYVVGLSFTQASAQLRGAGFEVQRQDVESNQPADTVIEQNPRGNTSSSRGSTVTLRVSKGPTTSSVPDVTSLDQPTAAATLRRSGFKVEVVRQPVEDPSQDGIVLDQNPPGGAQAPEQSTVTIYVGNFQESPPPPPPPQPPAVP
jgi:eukaryotic-like serine/threonine-protein kinase